VRSGFEVVQSQVEEFLEWPAVIKKRRSLAVDAKALEDEERKGAEGPSVLQCHDEWVRGLVSGDLAMIQ